MDGQMTSSLAQSPAPARSISPHARRDIQLGFLLLAPAAATVFLVMIVPLGLCALGQLL